MSRYEKVGQLEGLDRLRRYFSVPVADVIMSEGAQLLEPHRREVTILLCDLQRLHQIRRECGARRGDGRAQVSSTKPSAS